MHTQFRKIICLLSVIWVSNVSAGVITQVNSFTLHAPIHSLVPGINVLDPANLFDAFDTSLGELTSVDVSISGNLLATMEIPQHLVCTPGCVSIPHSYNLTVQPDFGLSTPASSFIFAGQGIATSLTGVVNFTHNYTFNETSDLFGFALASHSSSGNATAVIPPTIAGISRDDFVGPVNNFPLTWLYPSLSYNLNHTSQLPFFGNINLGGLILLTYHYDEIEEPVNVPEPPGLILLLSGLLMMAVARAKK